MGGGYIGRQRLSDGFGMGNVEYQQPILVQHDHGHHDEEMKMQFDLPSRDVHQEGRSGQESVGGDGGQPTAHDRKPCGEGNEREEGSSSEREAGSRPHVGAEQWNSQRVSFR